jgi:hypothetical protein
MLSKVLKAVAQRRNLFLRDQDAVVRKIASEHKLLRSSRQQQQHKDETDGCSTTMTAAAIPHFAFVVTRPTVLLQDGPSSKKLSASKSVSVCIKKKNQVLSVENTCPHTPYLTLFSPTTQQPGPFPVAHVDLAEFSLNALTTERLYNTSPYIVADSF